MLLETYTFEKLARYGDHDQPGWSTPSKFPSKPKVWLCEIGIKEALGFFDETSFTVEIHDHPITKGLSIFYDPNLFEWNISLGKKGDLFFGCTVDNELNHLIQKYGLIQKLLYAKIEI